MNIRIGIIGLGAMGLPIAQCILKKYSLNFYARKVNIIKLMEEKGAKYFESPYLLANSCDVIFIVVFDYEQCIDCLKGEEGILKSMFDGIIIFLSTVSPEQMREIQLLCQQFNIEVIEAPISGGVKAAQNGELTTIVSCEEVTWNKCEDIIKSFTRNTYYIGDCFGKSLEIKAINQLLVAVNILATAEAFYYAKKLNIDYQILYDIISKCSGNSEIFTTRGFTLVDGNYSTGKSSINLHLKDLKICDEISRTSSINTKLTNCLVDIYENAEKGSDNSLDAVSIIETFK